MGWDDQNVWQLVPARALFTACQHCKAQFPVLVRLEEDPYKAWRDGSAAIERKFCSFRCNRAALRCRKRSRMRGELHEREAFDALKLRAKRVREKLAVDPVVNA